MLFPWRGPCLAGGADRRQQPESALTSALPRIPAGIQSFILAIYRRPVLVQAGAIAIAVTAIPTPRLGPRRCAAMDW